MVSNKWDSSYAVQVQVQVYTVHYVQCKPDIVALEVKNWCRKVFLPHFAFCALVECFLVYSSDTLTLPFTEIWFDNQPGIGFQGGAGGADKTHILTSLELQDKCNVVVKMQTWFDSIHRGGLRYE